MKFFSAITALITVVLLISSCIPVPPDPTSSPIEASQTPSATSSQALETSRASIEPATTDVATLSPEFAQARINSLLQEPMDCEAPCFWGIIPGKTSIVEAGRILARLGIPMKRLIESQDDFLWAEYVTDPDISILFSFKNEDEVIKNIRVTITPESLEAQTPERWHAYSPATLIQRYGSPSNVSFALDWGPRSYLEMNVYYDAHDLIVQYIAYDLIPREPGSPKICPLISRFQSIKLWMGNDPVNPPLEAYSLEDATGLTTEEFSNLMLENPKDACFTVKGEIFRKP